MLTLYRDSWWVLQIHDHGDSPLQSTCAAAGAAAGERCVAEGRAHQEDRLALPQGGCAHLEKLSGAGYRRWAAAAGAARLPPGGDSGGGREGSGRPG